MSLLAFFLLTFTITWLAWVLPAQLAPASNGVFAPGGPVFLLGVVAPAMAAIALTFRRDGRPGVERMLARIGQWHVPARYYVFALGYLAATKLTAAAVHRVVTGTWPTSGDTPWVLMLGGILLSMWVQAGEEVGWRGYAPLSPRTPRTLGG